MVLPISHIFSNFMIDNQLYTNNHGSTEKAYHRIHRRGGKDSQKPSKVKENQQDPARQDRSSSSSGRQAFRTKLLLRCDRQEVGHFSKYGAHGGEAFCSRRSEGSADLEKKSQFGYLQDQAGRSCRGKSLTDCMWSSAGREIKMDASSFGGTLQGRAGGACEQGYYQARFKKNKLRPHKNTYWCIPAKESGDFVACMEDVLDVYERPYNADYPVVCVDELPYEMHGEAREPLAAKPGSDTKTDFEYVRCGTCSVFGAIEPLTGKCRVDASERRTKTDLARFLSEVAEDYPEAKKIVLVWDNLNTHKMGSLYETFEPTRARELASRFEVHYTPKHGSWLNVVEILLNILTKQCLKRRLDSIEKVTEELNKWVRVRNAKPKKIDWQFRTSKARIKLKSLYPEINILNQ